MFCFLAGDCTQTANMQAPSNFQPDVIQTNPPALTPPRYRKFDLYRDVNQFRHCDSHAVQVRFWMNECGNHNPIGVDIISC